MKFWKSKFVTYLLIVVTAALTAVNYEIFIFKNAFAPAGLNGIATMMQQIFHFSMGYVSLILNIPLCIAVFALGYRELGVRSFVYTAVFSACLLVFNLGIIDISPYAYHTENGTSTILAPVAAGVLNGLIYGIVFRRNGTTGGTDLIAAIVRHYVPTVNLVWMIFGLNSAVAAISFFVYDYKFEPVIMCILYSFITSKISDLILKGFKTQMKFEIITENAEEISRDIIKELHHTTTLLHGKGMFTHNDKDMLICVVQRHQVVQLRKIILRYPGSFAYMETVNEVYGNFNESPAVYLEKRPKKAKNAKNAEKAVVKAIDAPENGGAEGKD
ncbi:MAG: YitT family protein [Clostridia bacterium]|nr:YitT family protein [Clostridia bacterium]